MTKRKSLTQKRRVAFFLERGGRCEECGLKLLARRWEIDHIIALTNGGTNDPKNLRLLCEPCHKAKTRTDKGTMAKGDGVMAQNVGAKRPRRPMLGSRRHPSGLRKRMNGSITSW